MKSIQFLHFAWEKEIRKIICLYWQNITWWTQRTFKANKMKFFSLTRLHCETCCSRIFWMQNVQSRWNKGHKQSPSNTEEQLNPLSQESSNLQTGRAWSAQLRSRHCSSHLLSAGTHNQLMTPAHCWAQETFPLTQQNDFCVLKFTLIFTLLQFLSSQKGYRLSFGSTGVFLLSGRDSL